MSSRVLVYAQDGFGLGHQRRTGALAAGLLRALPGAAVLSVCDTPLGRIFEPHPGNDFVKLPSIVRTGPRTWDPLNLPVELSQLLALRRDMLRTVASGFSPDLLLVDHLPGGALGELVPVLDDLRGSGTRVVLGLRDILDAPDVVRRAWEADGSYEVLEAYYDTVLIYGQRDVFDVVDAYGFPAAIADRVRYTGYVCTPSEPRYEDDVAERFDTDHRALVLAMVGGGADGYPVLSTLLDAVPALVAERPCSFIILTGPFMPVDQRHDLQQRAEGLPVQVRLSVADSLSYEGAADAVVSMCGYNTTVEVLREKVPAVIVPRRGPSAEQRMRASRFAARGWVRVVDPDDLDAASMAAAVSAALADRDTPLETGDRPDLDGLEVAVRHLQDHLAPSAPVPAG